MLPMGLPDASVPTRLQAAAEWKLPVETDEDLLQLENTISSKPVMQKSVSNYINVLAFKIQA